jgi:hypothetical protein
MFGLLLPAVLVRGLSAVGGAIALTVCSWPHDAQAEAAAPPRLVVEGRLGGGLTIAQASSTYDMFDLEEDAGAQSHDRETAVAPAYEGGLFVGGSIRRSPVTLGLSASVSGSAKTSPFSGELERVRYLLLGPELLLSRPDLRGPYLCARAAVGLGSGERALAGDVSLGYAVSLPQELYLGIGASFACIGTRDSELGDHGRYDYLYRALVPGLRLRLGFRPPS